MKKNNKILILGLGLSLAFAPINSLVFNDVNISYAEKFSEKEEKEELSPEEILKKANDFLKSDDFKALGKDEQKEYKDLIKDLTVEDLNQEKADEIFDAIEKIELSYIGNKYQGLKKEVLKLKDNSLPKELIKDIDGYKNSYDTYEDYAAQIENLNESKKSIEDEKKDIKDLKEVLNKALKDNKNLGLDLKAEEAIYNKKDASYDEVNNAINSLNKKVEDYNAKVKEENRLANLSKLKKIIDEGESLKESYLYKKSGKELKEKFDASLENAKSAYKKLENKEEVNNVDVLLSAYKSAKSNLDGNKFEDEHKKLIEYFENNKDKLSGEDQEKFAKLINELPDKEESNLESIKKLKEDLDKALKTDPTSASLKKVQRKIAVPKTKSNRSFVRTGVKSVGIVLVVLIISALAYFFASKKGKK
ncbi:MAG: hypothetical protein E6296_07375 [Anaerococcus vaginalis]|nr:hypothetical protein [Anaerococcus vaginalis]